MRFLSLQLSPRWKFLVAILLLSSVSTYALIRSEKIREHVEETWELNNAKLVYLVDMRLTLKSGMRNLESALNSAQNSNAVTELQSLGGKLSQYQQLESRVGKIIEKSATSTRNEKALLHKIGVDRQATLPLIKKIEEMLVAGQGAAAADVFNKQLRSGPLAAWLAGLDELIQAENELNSIAGVNASAEYEQLRSSVLIMCALIVVLGLFSLWQTIKNNASE